MNFYQFIQISCIIVIGTCYRLSTPQPVLPWLIAKICFKITLKCEVSHVNKGSLDVVLKRWMKNCVHNLSLSGKELAILMSRRRRGAVPDVSPKQAMFFLHYALEVHRRNESTVIFRPNIACITQNGIAHRTVGSPTLLRRKNVLLILDLLL